MVRTGDDVYLRPVHWVMDDGGLRFLEEEEEKEKRGGETRNKRERREKGGERGKEREKIVT